MKRFENIFRTLSLVWVMLLAVGMHIKAEAAWHSMDSVEVGLLTCSPHDEVYSIYGHTALHWHDLRTGYHYVFNYGVFDFNKPHFVWRFVMGHTDYRLECTSHFAAWCDYYRKWGSSVEEQVLALTPTEKRRLQEALAKNLQHPVYRYNFFYDNCSTRPRDIVERCLEGRVSYGTDQADGPTLREMVHQCAVNSPWTAFGNDLLLGVMADRPTTQRVRQFLPACLSRDLDSAVVDRKGRMQPLVLRRVTHVQPGAQQHESGFPLSPFACTLLLLLISTVIAAYEWRTERIQVWWDALLMLVTGLCGCILTLMIFSEHPATSINLQLLMLNPLQLLFIPAVLKRKKTRWFQVYALLLLLFLLGGFFQDYARGMEIVALCLLIRSVIHNHDK